MALEKELATYNEKLPELIPHEGKFVLIQGDNIIDVFGTYEDAIKHGYGQFKLEPFLVKKIASIEHAQFVARFSPVAS